ncbi:putative histidine acid phosphatase [Aspergillus clavatus NRRL 1]|uniref:Histidine acid phosphatase, putative n=1 Tax=Aspergillus clavatus (strain ATCC 1007 / CBS 513.65 / DSM 816 / NCTC 3887 / NRRL 1 / QM 1276 / 107) TaxID=344612 RepID=A1C5G4_ASPCL|nr:histidine acid phosphatase, putative [Aspergillus clavatus NRRL 1]EAW14932.1 histidine acid phosphatase, putative [Aspergillus clavatus NRRL 1]
MRTSLESTSVLLALMAMPLASAEKVLGAYIFARHGDRTPKVLGNTELTDLGYLEVFQTGSYYHDRYIASNSSHQIQGISDEVVTLSQISASAPEDSVLQNSATGFLQGVYPPVGSVASQKLSNGKTVEAPLNGYQLIPLALIETNANSEDNTWLQAATGCQNAKVSSNSYYDSALYKDLLASTGAVYKSLSSYLDKTFTDSQMSFKSAYTIWDYLNVASIHNSSSDYPSEEVRQQLFQLANIEQYSLAYNSSDSIRAIAGSTLAGEVLQALNKTITSQGKTKLNIQFGSYGTFLSYFGLAQLPAASVDFTGIPDYASSMAWELVTDSTSNEFPSASEISVRFLFHNGTISGAADPSEFPLYGQSSVTIPWSDFVGLTEKIAITSNEQWCKACGNTNGQCAAYTATATGSSSSPAADASKGGLSLPVAGVIGAMVTLAVVLGLEALFLLFGGFRITKKRSAVSGVEAMSVEGGKKA